MSTNKGANKAMITHAERRGPQLATRKSTAADTISLTVVNSRGATPRGSPRNARHTHGRQRAADSSLGGGDDAVKTWTTEFRSCQKAKRSNDCRQQQDAWVSEHNYFPSGFKLLGSSSKSATAAGSNFLASAGMTASKLSAPASAPVFQDLTSMVYCGDPGTCVLVMT